MDDRDNDLMTYKKLFSNFSGPGSHVRLNSGGEQYRQAGDQYNQFSENTTRANSPTPIIRGGSSLIDILGDKA